MHNTILLFTRNGMGDAPAELQQRLAVKFLSLLAAASQNPVLYRGRHAGLQRTGDFLAAQAAAVAVAVAGIGAGGHPAGRTTASQSLQRTASETCLETYGLQEQVAVGIVGGMPDIIEAMRMAEKVISL